MRKYPIYLQDDEISCGVYCIKVAFYYNYSSQIQILNICFVISCSE